MGWGLKPVRQRHGDALAGIHWREFERLLAEHYRQQGFAVDACGTGGRRARFDGGIDLRLTRGGDTVLVQCKHWNAMQVPHNAVHELIGIVIAQGAARGILVSSGEFTDAARRAALASGRVTLIDGVALRAMLGERLATLAATSAAQGATSARERTHTACRAASAADARIDTADVPPHDAQHDRSRRRMRRRRRRGPANIVARLVVFGIVFLAFWLYVEHVADWLHDRLMPQRAAQPMSPSTAARAARAAAPAPMRIAHRGAGTARASGTSASADTLPLHRQAAGNAVRALDGVRSVAFLPDGTLFVGTDAATLGARSRLGMDACGVLAGFPDLTQAVEVQQTAGHADGVPLRIACGTTPARTERRARATAPVPAQIVMYESPNCGYCKQARAYFARRGLAYRSVDVTASAANYAEFRRLGGRETPLILIDGKAVRGFSGARLDRAIAGARI